MMFEEKKNNFMESRCFPGDFKQRVSFNDMGLEGFPPSSSSNRFCSSDDRSMIVSHQDTKDSLVGLCQNLSEMGFSDTRTRTSIFTGSTNLYGCSKIDQDLSFPEVSSRFQGPVQRSHGRQVSTTGYVCDGDYNKLLLGLQDFPNPNSRVFTEIMSHRQNRNLSAMGGSRELINGGNEQDLPLNLASVVGIYGSLYLMAKDQKGCKFLQNFLEIASFLDVMIIYRRVINHVVELSIDPSGNFFIQKLLQVCNEEQRTQILFIFTLKPGLFLQISLDYYGTRVVQKLIETVSTKEQISLIKSALKPGFLSLVNNINGNHVIQTCLHYLGPDYNQFVLEDATRFCTAIATHRHGCSVLQHCVLYSVGVEREKLVAEISRNSLHLAQDPFGNYVVQYIIEQKLGGVDVMFELRGNYVKLAKQKFGSHVVEKCLRHYPESRDQIVCELVSVPKFENLLQDPYANYVIQSALSVTKGFVRESLVKKVKRCGNLSKSPYCKKIFSKKSLLKK